MCPSQVLLLFFSQSYQHYMMCPNLPQLLRNSPLEKDQDRPIRSTIFRCHHNAWPVTLPTRRIAHPLLKGNKAVVSCNFLGVRLTYKTISISYSSKLTFTFHGCKLRFAFSLRDTYNTSFNRQFKTILRKRKQKKVRYIRFLLVFIRSLSPKSLYPL